VYLATDDSAALVKARAAWARSALADTRLIERGMQRAAHSVQRATENTQLTANWRCAVALEQRLMGT
jgi:hypothetical protein